MQLGQEHTKNQGKLIVFQVIYTMKKIPLLLIKVKGYVEYVGGYQRKKITEKGDKMPSYVAGCGNPHAKLMVVAEAPGRDEDASGINLVGPAGQLFWQICDEVGFTREQVWSTNVYKYRPPNNDLKRVAEVCNPQEQVDNLWREIDDINPNCILALGNTSFQILRGHPGITKWRGSILKTRDARRKLIGTIHTSNVVRTAEGFYGHKPWPYIWKFIIKCDVEKAWKEAQNTHDNSIQRHVFICHDSMQLRNFLSRNKHRKRMAEDVESFNCIPICVGIAFDRYESMVIPLFNRLGPLNIAGIPASDQAFIWQQLDELQREKEIVGQNFKYDQEKMEMIGFSFRRGRPIISDTLLKTHTIIPELPSKKMEMQQSIWTNMPYHKDEGKEFKAGKDKIERLFHYNGLDSMSTYETDEEQDKDLQEMGLTEFYYDYVMQLHEIYMDMERVGFRQDKTAKEMLKIKYRNQHDLIQARLNDACPDFKVGGKKCHDDHRVNVGSHPQMVKLLYQYLQLPERRRYDHKQGKSVISANEDTIVGLLNNVVKNDSRKRGILTDCIEDRRTRKTLGTYVLAKTDFDSRIRGSYRIAGTETGRSSTAILKAPLRPYKMGHAFQTLTKHGTIGADIRIMYIVDDGFVFVGADLSQAEPRIVSVISKDIPLQKAFQSGKVDIHRRTAALVLGYTDGLDLGEAFNEKADNIGKDSGERFLGKKSRNGGNYDMGPGELATNIATDAKRFNINVSVSEWRAGQMLNNFHKGSPNIRSIFHAEIQSAINSTRTLVNPFGRKRTFFGRLEKRTYGEAYAHIPQSTVADQVKHAMIGIKGEMSDFRYMLMGESHDALLFRFPVGEYIERATVVKKWLEKPIDFSNCTLGGNTVLTIPAEFEMSDTNYNEMRKFKVEE